VDTAASREGGLIGADRRATMNSSLAPVGARFIRSGIGIFCLGLVMSFGIVGHYLVGARYDTGGEFLKNMTLWYACPWTLSTSVVLIGAVGMIAIGTAYASLGRDGATQAISGTERVARIVCLWALIAMFVTGYVGYFVVDIFWPGYYYVPIKTGKAVWLLMQLTCMVAYLAGVILAFGGIRRLTATGA
jgi:hypothetical protein